MTKRKGVQLCQEKKNGKDLNLSRNDMSFTSYDNSLNAYRAEHAEHDHLEDVRYFHAAQEGGD